MERRLKICSIIAEQCREVLKVQLFCVIEWNFPHFTFRNQS